MRLLTFRAGSGDPHIGVLHGDGDNVLDLTVWLGQSAPADMLSLIKLGDAGLEMCRQALGTPEAELQARGALVPLDPSKLLAPIPRPTKNIMCLGRNYPEHLAESTRAFGEQPQPAPTYPIFFTKAPTSVAGPYAGLHISFGVSTQIDWEGELAFVIGKAGKDITAENAMQHVFGYLVLNDISARDVQKRHGNQFFKGKSLDDACPIGPWIVTMDEVPDPADLRIVTRVNGTEKQNGYTGDMFAGVEEIVRSLSEGMTLEAGDIIATGTPAGVGHARNPPEFLKPGDTVEVEIEGIGLIRNQIFGD